MKSVKFAFIALASAIVPLGVVLAPLAQAQVVDSSVVVAMRDGVALRAIVMRPSTVGRFPTLVYRTPYGAESAVRDYATFGKAVARGYAVVVQDVRGRYRSDGRFDPYRQEGLDGYDTIEWAAAQTWSNGKVGTFGLSYPGAVQWLAAVESPPHLEAMVPAMTFSRPDNFWYAGGLLDLSWNSWIWFSIAPDERRRLNLPGPRTGRESRAAWDTLAPALLARLPVTDVPELAAVAPWYQEWLSHGPNDPWWSWADLRTRYARTRAAVLNISGWHDEAYGPEGAITNFQGLLASRAGERHPRAFLVLGPWEHGSGAIDDRSATAASGERVFGASAGLDYDELVLRFLDRYVRGVDNGVDSEPRVRAFVMGENRWHSSDDWPFGWSTHMRLSLGRAARGKGTLSARIPSEGSWTIVSDPRKPIVDPYGAAYGAHDYRALAERDDVMVFETEPFAHDTRVLGRIEVNLTVSVDAPDADLYVRLFDVSPRDTAWNLMSPGLEVTRLSERAGGRTLVPGQRSEVRIGQHLTGNLFRAGHRLRAVVMPSFLPHFAPNLAAEGRSPEPAKRSATRITLHFGEHGSRITLPLLGEK
ncbi:MAG: CocE/NonD family hydrolase [Anaerolineae bacterium]|nr:CocE/NonD family hydrolase [Gemmatimonadaceae bacterium]